MGTPALVTSASGSNLGLITPPPLSTAISEVTKTILSKDRERFVEIMDNSKKYFTEDKSVWGLVTEGEECDDLGD